MAHDLAPFNTKEKMQNKPLHPLLNCENLLCMWWMLSSHLPSVMSTWRCGQFMWCFSFCGLSVTQQCRHRWTFHPVQITSFRLWRWSGIFCSTLLQNKPAFLIRKESVLYHKWPGCLAFAQGSTKTHLLVAFISVFIYLSFFFPPGGKVMQLKCHKTTLRLKHVQGFPAPALTLMIFSLLINLSIVF